MRIFFDTNVLIASFISHGQCAEIFEHCLSEHEILISHWVLEEFKRTLSEKFNFSGKIIIKAVSFLREYTVKVSPKPLKHPICRDPDDDNILAGALQGNADCIITGDKDLLILEKFKGIPILKPGEFWKFKDEITS
ncbi:putative toxin-antitoxin system toxin component, PIN family [candidate division WOR-3 bacterium]|nr:putative toxin-antitoxin system toxin component, PIN family [candidate division WOR-3 bacterium]